MASSRIWIGQYDFDLADIATPHTIALVAMSAEGPAAFTMQDWSSGQQSIEEGLEFRKLPKYISSTGTDPSFSGQVLVQPLATTIPVGSGPALGAIIKQVDFTPSGGSVNTYLFSNTVGNIFRLVNPGVTNQWTSVFSAGYVHFDAVVHDGKLGVGVGSAGQFYTPSGTTWTQATANKAFAYGSLVQNLYRAQRPNTVFAATALDGTWDSGSSIADASFNINSLTGIEQVLMIGKEDGVYSIDIDGTVVPFTPELRTQANASFASIQASDSFNNDYYFRTLNGVIEISGTDGQKTRVGFDQLANPDLPTVVVKGLSHDDRFLYAVTENASGGIMILRRSIRGAWHVYWYDSTINNAEHIEVSSVFGYPALFFSYNTGGTRTVKMIRLSTFPNPLQDTSYSYDTTAHRIRMPRYGSAEFQTVWDQLTIQSRGCTANQTITPYYAADGGAVTQFGSTAVTSSPFTTIRPATPVTANFIDIYLELVTNATSASPVLTGFSLKGIKRPNRRRVHTYTVVAGRGHRDIRSGQRLVAPTETAANAETLLATNTYQVVKDERGATFSGLVQGATRTFIRPTAGEEAQEAIQLQIAELS